ncbi:MAG: UpxY family transcription antiterminator [Ignavibacteriota bacterium]
MAEVQNIKNWHVLYTHSRAEFKVEQSLRVNEIEVFLPTMKTIKQWTDRKKEIIEALFKSYIFIFATEKDRLLSLEDKHVVRCLCDTGKPAIIPEWQIENLKRIINADRQPEVIEGLMSGTKVEITNGAFIGVCGTIVKIENKNHLAISIELINRTVIVHITDETTFKNL